MSMVLVLGLLSAAPVRVAAPGMNAVNLSVEEVALHAEVLSQQLHARHLEVVSARDVQAMLGLERQQQLMGCPETSCVAEFAGALGVEGLLLGDIGRLPDGYAVNLKVLSTKTDKPVALFNGRAANSEQLSLLLARAAWEIVAQLGKALGHPELIPVDEPPTIEPQPSVKLVALVPLAVGVGAGIVGGVYLNEQAGAFKRLGAAQTIAEADLVRREGVEARTKTVIAFTVAGAGVAAAAAVFFLAGNRNVRPTVSLSPSGAQLGVAGVFP